MIALPRKSIDSGYTPGEITTESPGSAALIPAWIVGYCDGTRRSNAWA